MSKENKFMDSRNSNKIKLIRVLIIYACFITMMSGTLGCANKNFSNRPSTNRVVIGGLFSTTGNWATLGQASKAAMEIAIEDVNAHFAGNSRGVEFSMMVKDTMLDPALALKQLEALHTLGVRFVIGPMSSAEVIEIKDFVDKNGIIIISQSSTAGTLSISGDNIFRFSPDDTQEGRAVATLMRTDGIKTVVPMWRDDAGNNGLQIAARASFEAMGGKMRSGVKYDAQTTEFSSYITTLGAQVREAIEADGKQHVAVYLAAFDKVVKIFELAKDDPVLSTVRWYGSDGVVFSEALLANTGGSSEFAQSAVYPNPIFGLDASLENKWGPITEKIKKRAGVQPNAFALAVYDAVWVVAKTYLAAKDPKNVESFNAAFVDEANSFMGITESTALNAAGDRKVANFDFWGVRKEGDTFLWKKVATYNGQSGTAMYVE
jgi:branched-chain amino acid transport system substrate-binding protein